MELSTSGGKVCVTVSDGCVNKILDGVRSPFQSEHALGQTLVQHTLPSGEVDDARIAAVASDGVLHQGGRAEQGPRNPVCCGGKPRQGNGLCVGLIL